MLKSLKKLLNTIGIFKKLIIKWTYVICYDWRNTISDFFKMSFNKTYYLSGTLMLFFSHFIKLSQQTYCSRALRNSFLSKRIHISFPLQKFFLKIIDCIYLKQARIKLWKVSRLCFSFLTNLQSIHFAVSHFLRKFSK